MKIPAVHRLQTSAVRAAANESGVTAIEFGMVLPILIALFVCIYDLGMGVYTNTQLSAAAQFGAGWAVQNGYDAATITARTQAATALTGVTVTPTQFCGCPSATGVTVTSCSSTCSDGLMAGTFAQVAAAKDYTPIMRYPGLPAVFHLNQQATVRLQ